jgi:signal transduction histidine kinase
LIQAATDDGALVASDHGPSSYASNQVDDLISRCLIALRCFGFALLAFQLTRTSALQLPRDARHPAENPSLSFALWVLYGVLLYLSTSPSRAKSRSMPAILAAESLISLYVIWLQPGSAMSMVCYVIAWNIAIIYPPKKALFWIAMHSCAITALYLYLLAPGNWGEVPGFLTYLGFRAFSSVVVMFAKQEADSRAHLAHVNAQLNSTRELLTERSRAQERLEISRRLHDTVGHHLAALYLHLEIAKNGRDNDQMIEHISKAQTVSREILGDVRGVVRSLRDSAAIDLEGALEALNDELPGLKLHLQKPDRLQVSDPYKAETIIHCVQEIITNTLKHSGARQLWICVEETGGEIRVTAHDDGRVVEPRQSAGLGLIGMKERFLEHGGWVEVHVDEHQQQHVEARLPLSPAAAIA